MQYSITWFLNGKRSSLLASLLLPSVLCLGCGGPAPLTVDMPLHLEDHLDAATVVGSEVPAELLEPVEWRFDEPQPDWKPVERREPGIKPVQATRTEDALRLTLTEANRGSRDNLHGGIYIDLPDWSREDWAYVEIRARTSDRMESIRLGFNYTEEDPFDLGVPSFLVTDGTIQTYRLPLNSPGMRLWEGPWTHLAVLFASQTDEEAATLDILSIRVVPRRYEYRENAVSVHSPRLGGISRRAIVTYPPSRLEWRVRVPEGGRLDLASGLLDGASDVTFRVNVTVDGDEVVVFEEASADASAWHLGSVDLGAYAGRTIGLTLETESEREGAVAFWGAPTVSGDRPPDEPNVIFYVIDGAGADWMSLYGYNRRTTPFLERLARDAVVFEHAYSNATSTPLSAPSYMTSLLFSAIMPYRSFFDRVPDGVTTMAEHFARNGWQTGVFTSNPHASSARGLDRNVDRAGLAPIENATDATSSQYLQRAFWEWRDAWVGQPFWAHFQTTDVHEPFETVAPFAGLFLAPEMRERYFRWDELELCNSYLRPLTNEREASCAAAGGTEERFALAQQALYDEGMAHQDHQLERLVARLQAAGQYENTILVIASDHGYPAASHRVMPGMARGAPYIHPFATRVPLMFVWPGHIAGGRRIRTPVSMLDVLPTLLELVGLPQPDLKQGQSLAPLLLGQVAEAEWESRPVIVDVLVEDVASGQLMGNIEMIDGRWGASLCVRPAGTTFVRRNHVYDALVGCVQARRPERLLLYDLWEDPLLQRPVNAERPDLVEKYTALLEAQVEANAAIRKLVGAGGERVSLTPEQLQTLRTLGYIQ